MIAKVLLWVVVASSLILRLFLFQFSGGDQPTYKEAVEQFYSGQNPYKYTVDSYKTNNSEHGYAYLPTLLYIQTFFYWVNTVLDLDKPLHILWKIPVLVCDYIVAFLIYFASRLETCFTQGLGRGIRLRNISSSKIYPILAMSAWLFNPYILTRFEINTYDIIGIALLLAGLFFFEKSHYIKSGLFIMLAISLKVFCVAMWPYLFLIAGSKKRLLLGTIAGLLIICLPFAISLNDLLLMLNGSILVHSQRGFQGRPVIGLISLMAQKMGFVVTTPTVFEFLAPASILIPTIIGTISALKRVALYKALLFIVALYLLLTPVLSRTHLLWGIPLFLVVIKRVKPMKQLCVLLGGYVLVYAYLFLWQTGFNFGETGWVSIDDFSVRESRLYKLYKYGKYQ